MTSVWGNELVTYVVGSNGAILAKRSPSPWAGSDSGQTTEDDPTTIDALVNDCGLGDFLGISAVDDSTALGSASIGNGEIVYDPGQSFQYLDDGESAVDWFRYTITNSINLTATAAITISITGSNDPPVAVDDTVNTDEDVSLEIHPLANDNDVDGDSLPIVALGTPTHGIASEGGGTFYYTPTLNFYGTDVFSYTISDGDVSATAKVTVTVLSITDPPVATRDTVSTDEDTPVSILVLANDSDVEGDSLSVGAVSAPGNGVATTDGETTANTISALPIHP